MPASLAAKRAYCAQVRRANYVASLRLEGFDVSEKDATKPLPTREDVIKRYRNSRSA